ncbi:type IV secretion system protein [Variovorax sp. MHTC-1]|uniref:type IV secretion system protein n=1 Tax=Variovorax sp. MHTC-1 TaxID=2495593 RepID=UPI000F87D3A5|nr:type IV secretion system protein [Variovorax sp. MHTC-1]RST50029.1 type IV secretion system protein [Variovorax sp. MHTC-1]
MGLFTQFFAWINMQVADYVSTNTARVASALEPAVVTLATIYVMMWGFLSLAGRIQEPIWEGIRRILLVVLILGVALRLWAYNDVIASTFYTAPDQLAAAVIGAPNVVSVVDQVWLDGTAVAEHLLNKGSILDSDFAYYAAGFLVYLLVGLTVVVTAFMLALAKIALAILLALGPLFIAMLFFDATRRFFEAWVAQLANYALIGILALFCAALLLSVLKAYAASAAASGSGITIAESTRVCMVSALVFLVMRQVMPIAAGLASGVGLSTYGAVSGAIRWGMGGTRRSAYEFSRGLFEGIRGQPGGKWDSLRRLAGNRAGMGIANTLSRLAGPYRGGTVIPREHVMRNPNSLR